MASSIQYKHAFDFLYKWTPSGSGQLTNVTWSQHYNQAPGYNVASRNMAMSASWYDLNILNSGVSTRHTASIISTEGALAWASIATDMLWNVLSPSMSISQSVNTGALRAQTYYQATYNSESILYRNFFPHAVNPAGVFKYPVTSSWIAYEPKMIRFASGSGVGAGYEVRGVTYPTYFPGTIQSANYLYSLPSSASLPTSTYPNVGQNPSRITYSANSTGSNDGRFFDLAGGCGITRQSISASLYAFNASASVNTTNARYFCTTQLKNRRLFFPTVRPTGSTLQFNDADYWVNLATGRRANAYFKENGGIYNVKFNIKRDAAYDYYPDTGEDSQLLVFLHNIDQIIPTPSNRISGADGWYPPEANIVRIKNTPAMSFYNPASGFLIESFNINVIQYGSTAQLVFEASGSLDSNQYFGCIIDDVEFCKIGVTTDPALIKPTTPAQYTEAANNQIR